MCNKGIFLKLINCIFWQYGNFYSYYYWRNSLMYLFVTEEIPSCTCWPLLKKFPRVLVDLYWRNSLMYLLTFTEEIPSSTCWPLLKEFPHVLVDLYWRNSLMYLLTFTERILSCTCWPLLKEFPHVLVDLYWRNSLMYLLTLLGSCCCTQWPADGMYLTWRSGMYLAEASTVVRDRCASRDPQMMQVGTRTV